MPNGLALAINILIVLILLSYIVSMMLNFFSPYYSTPKKVLKEIVKKFNLKKDQRFADLGCGDGRVVWTVHSMYKCFSDGYEFSPVLLMFIKLCKSVCAPFNKRVRFIEEDFFKVDLKDYDVIYCALPDDSLKLLEKKFKKELKEGTKVFCYKNQLPTKKGESIKVGDKSLYEYTY